MSAERNIVQIYLLRRKLSEMEYFSSLYSDSVFPHFKAFRSINSVKIEPVYTKNLSYTFLHVHAEGEKHTIITIESKTSRKQTFVSVTGNSAFTDFIV